MVTIDESIPARSKWGLAARDVFLEQFSEINFYVEDENQENFYLEVFAKLFPNILISQIFGLGGKANVLEHSSDPANGARQARSIYVLDKDFDDLLGKIQRRGNVFYLDKYCIENYLFDEDALVAIAIECHPRKTREQHLRELAFPAFLSLATTSLEPLFRLFFVVQKLELGIRNCDRKPEEFSNKHRVWTVSSAAIRRYREEVLKRALELNKIRNVDELQALLDNCFPNDGPPDRNISGKFILGVIGSVVSLFATQASNRERIEGFVAISACKEWFFCRFETPQGSNQSTASNAPQFGLVARSGKADLVPDGLTFLQMSGSIYLRSLLWRWRKPMERNCLPSLASFVEQPKSSVDRIPFRNFDVRRASRGFTGLRTRGNCGTVSSLTL